MVFGGFSIVGFDCGFQFSLSIRIGLCDLGLCLCLLRYVDFRSSGFSVCCSLTFDQWVYYCLFEFFGFCLILCFWVLQLCEFRAFVPSG